MAAPTVAQIDERIASVERNHKKLIAGLREDRRKALARERQEDREFQNLVRDWVGELVLSRCPGGWRAVDPDDLELALSRAVAGLEPEDEAPLHEAQARWRKWRKGGKGESPAPKGSVQEALPAREPDREEPQNAPGGSRSDVCGEAPAS